MEQLSCYEIVLKLEPFYNKLHSKYSASYLKGSDWYVGTSLTDWWNKSINYRKKRKELFHIIRIILLNENIINSYEGYDDPFEIFLEKNKL